MIVANMVLSIVAGGSWPVKDPVTLGPTASDLVGRSCSAFDPADRDPPLPDGM